MVCTLAGVDSVVEAKVLGGGVEGGVLFGKVDVGIESSVVLDMLFWERNKWDMLG